LPSPRRAQDLRSGSVRRALRAAQRGLGIVADSSASVDPGLHANLLLAEGSALWRLHERNVVATFHPLPHRSRLKRRAGNDAGVERLSELLWRQIDHRVRVMESVHLLGGEVDRDLFKPA
jgi:hypothetical protein